MNDPSVIILVADGLRPDTLDGAISAGQVPELAALRALSGRHIVTTVFPSVTGVAYVPFLTGRHPAGLGVPGLRWYDRARELPAILGHSRSYVGVQVRAIDRDLDARAPTLFELAPGRALGSMAMVTRGLRSDQRLDRGGRFAARAILAHVSGDVAGWSRLEEELAQRLVHRIRRERPRVVVAAFTAGDKASHASGSGSRASLEALQRVDGVIGELRRDAERDGRWTNLHLFVVSDHGHAPISSHFDLAEALRERGLRVRAHPRTFPDRAEVAVMVSGNSMAHVYLDLGTRTRRSWSELRAEWQPRVGFLMSHPAVDLVSVMRSPTTIEVHGRDGHAEIGTEGGYSYRPVTANPLGVEPFEGQSWHSSHERTLESAYPDGVAQLAQLVLAPRSGDLVISASRDWDLRRAFEPVRHVSSHGGLQAAHMLVPLVGNRQFVNRPRRTADVFALAASALGTRVISRPREDLLRPSAARGT